MEKEKIYVVGAGVAGLTAAHQLLLKKKFSVSIFEKESYTGGKIRTLTDNEIYIDTGAQFFFSSNRNIFKLINSLNINHQVEKIHDFGINICHNNKLVPMTVKGLLLNTSLKEKSELLKIMWHLKKTIPKINDKIYFETTTKEWYEENIGNNLLWLFDSILRGLCFADSSKLSANYGIQIIYPALFDGYLSFNKGMQIIPLKLKDRIIEMGGDINMESLVTRITVESDKISGFEYKNNDETNYVPTKNIVSSIPLPILHKILDKKIIAFGDVKYSSVIYVLLFFKKRILKQDEDILFSSINSPIYAIANETLKYPKNQGNVLGIILSVSKDLLFKGEIEIKNFALEQLNDFMSFDDSDIIHWEVFIWEYALPICSPDFYTAQRKSRMHYIEGLHLCGECMGYPSLDGAIESSYRLCEQISKPKY